MAGVGSTDGTLYLISIQFVTLGMKMLLTPLTQPDDSVLDASQDK